MKNVMNIFRYITVLLLPGLLLLAGCSDFLDEKPQGNTGTTGSFYKNTSDIEYALTAAYADLQASGYYSNNLVLLTDVRSDDLGTYSNAGANAGREYYIKIFTAQSDNQIFRNVWAKIYETIYRCNNVVKYADVVSNEKLRRQYEAEARFLRALSYFNIVRLWGAAPLILEPLAPAEVALCGRNGTDEIYAAIEADLLYASDVNNLPKSFSGANRGRATYLAVKGMLGKVYIQQKKWNEAKTVLAELVDTDNAGTHTLMTDIADVFATAPPHGSPAADFRNYTGWNPQKFNKEVLFSVLFNKDISGEGRNALSYYASQADINEELKSSSPRCIYAASDRRSDLMLSIRGTNSDNALLVKYADVISTTSQYGYSTPVLRWADVLLMYAEALNETGYDPSPSSPALQALNRVRTRSYPGGAYTAAGLPDQDAFKAAVLLERRLEFPMEMQRWFDLIRTGKAIEAIGRIGYTISEKDLLFPVPASEVNLRNDKGKFPQNPGY